MWFNNLQLLRIPVHWPITIDQLEEQLARGPFAKCPSHQPISRGWVSPRKDGGLVFSVGKQWLIALCIEERLLPSSVVNDEVKERAETLEAQQGYAPGRKQMKELRERITEEMMPRAFTKKHITYAWLDVTNGWLAVNAPSFSKAEELIDHLRQCLDALPVTLLSTQISPQSAMADWLAGGDTPAGFAIDRDCELKAAGEEKAAVRYVRHPLDGDEISGEIKAHLAAGKMPTKLALTWDERISFVLGEKLEIKRLSFLDLLKDEAEKSAEHADEQFDADFALMTGELARFLPQLVAALGGEVKPDDDLVSKAEERDLEFYKAIGGQSPEQRAAAFTAEVGPDPLYCDALAIVLDNQRASISLVQRHLRIGYNRAARLLEDMEKQGAVSIMAGDGSRQVLITHEALREARKALRKLDAMAKEDGTTITIEHQGEVLATVGRGEA